MKMMDRLVEGRGHRREIDMLLELTYVSAYLIFVIFSLIYSSLPSTENKLKVEQFVHLVMPQLGRFKG